MNRLQNNDFRKKRKYPFMIENKDSSDKESTHCLSIMDIDPKIDLLFLLIQCSWLEKFHNTGQSIGDPKNTPWN